jgi:hypothetical protein
MIRLLCSQEVAYIRTKNRADTKSVEIIPLKVLCYGLCTTHRKGHLAGLKTVRTQNQLKLSLYGRQCYVIVFTYVFRFSGPTPPMPL